MNTPPGLHGFAHLFGKPVGLSLIAQDLERRGRLPSFLSDCDRVVATLPYPRLSPYADLRYAGTEHPPAHHEAEERVADADMPFFHHNAAFAESAKEKCECNEQGEYAKYQGEDER